MIHNDPSDVNHLGKALSLQGIFVTKAFGREATKPLGNMSIRTAWWSLAEFRGSVAMPPLNHTPSFCQLSSWKEQRPSKSQAG